MLSSFLLTSKSKDVYIHYTFFSYHCDITKLMRNVCKILSSFYHIATDDMFINLNNFI